MQFTKNIFLLGAFAKAAATETPREYLKYSFDEFKEEFGKTYTTSEHAIRAKLFEKKLSEVKAHNEEYKAGLHTWFAAVNEFTDWTDEEFSKLKSGKAAHNVHNHPIAQLTMGQANPSRVDWREKDAVTPVKNQGSCGSCWAFSAIEAVESHYAIATGNLKVLAPQAYVNCVKNPKSCGGTGGCEGATMELAFNLTAQMGVPLESDLPYKEKDASCSPYKAAVKSTGYVKVPINDKDALETAVATKGPVSVSVATGHIWFEKNWAMYGGGIFSGGCKTWGQDRGCELDHGLLAVGYDNSGEGYWLVRNSWGESWVRRDTSVSVGRTMVSHTQTAILVLASLASHFLQCSILLVKAGFSSIHPTRLASALLTLTSSSEMQWLGARCFLTVELCH